MWNKLISSYEGNEKVKDVKLQTFRLKFEQLKMNEDEIVSKYFLRFEEIVNAMKGLGEKFDVRKTGPRSNKIKQMQKQNTEDTQYKRDTDLRGSPSVGYVHQRNCQVLPLLLSSK
jgi:hypothetical protein